jgi:hypothetical protein
MPRQADPSRLEPKRNPAQLRQQGDIYDEYTALASGKPPSSYTDANGVVWDAPDPNFVPAPALEYTAGEYYGEDPMDALMLDQMGPSAMEGIAPNQWAVQSQWDALEGVRDIYDQGGLTAIDRARIAEARAGEDAYLRGQRESSMAEMNARGMGGSGQELLSQLVGQQGAGQRMAMAGAQTEAMALQRRDQALQDAFGMSTGLRGQQFDEEARIAAAKDEIAKMNAAAGWGAKTATWESERDRRTRESAGRTAHSMDEAGRRTAFSTYAHEEPFNRLKDRQAFIESNAGIRQGEVAGAVGLRNAGTARMGMENEKNGRVMDFGKEVMGAFTGGG